MDTKGDYQDIRRQCREVLSPSEFKHRFKEFYQRQISSIKRFKTRKSELMQSPIRLISPVRPDNLMKLFCNNARPHAQSPILRPSESKLDNFQNNELFRLLKQRQKQKIAIRESPVPIEAVYNPIVNKIKEKELSKNMRSREYSFTYKDRSRVKSLDNLK